MSTGIDIRDLELNALLEITQAINNNLSEKDLYRIYRFTLLADLKLKKMALYVKDEKWQCKVYFDTEKDWSKVQLPEAFHSLNEITDQLPEDFSEFDQAIPVAHKDRLLAVVFVSGVAKEDVTSSSTFLKALTNIIIVAIENKKLAREQLRQEAYRKELEIAKRVQNYLFPKTLPVSDRLTIEAVYLPHQDVGGDYYDYLPIDDQRFLICIADVSGKGVPAALLMSNFQASLRTLIRKTRNLEEIVRELNHAIASSSDGENFITFFLAMYDYESGEYEYINCGHNPLYLLSEDKLYELNDGTTVLGMFDPLPFLKTVKLSGLKNFFFFGYTDGLTETFNSQEEPYGEERVIEKINAGSPSNLQAFHQEILKDIDEFREDTPYRDDITMLSCLVRNPS